MPNHVINEILLHGVKLEDCRRHILNEAGRVSFAVLLPLPLNYWPGSVGIEREKAFPGTHLDAARDTWGTKWNAYGDPTAEDTEAGTLIRFQSAWNHPRGWTCALFNTLKCEITVKWLSEGSSDGMEEKFVWDAKGAYGPSWEHKRIPERSEEHRHLHMLLWGEEERLVLESEDEDD
jgi:hypothetical protein